MRKLQCRSWLISLNFYLKCQLAPPHPHPLICESGFRGPGFPIYNTRSPQPLLSSSQIWTDWSPRSQRLYPPNEPIRFSQEIQGVSVRYVNWEAMWKWWGESSQSPFKKAKRGPSAAMERWWGTDLSWIFQVAVPASPCSADGVVVYPQSPGSLPLLFFTSYLVPLCANNPRIRPCQSPGPNKWHSGASNEFGDAISMLLPLRHGGLGAGVHIDPKTCQQNRS